MANFYSFQCNFPSPRGHRHRQYDKEREPRDLLHHLEAARPDWAEVVANVLVFDREVAVEESMGFFAARLSNLSYIRAKI